MLYKTSTIPHKKATIVFFLFVNVARVVKLKMDLHNL